KREDSILARCRSVAPGHDVGGREFRPQPCQLDAVALGERLAQVGLLERPAQRRHDRSVPQLALGELEAFSDQHELPRPTRAPLDLTDQTALAHAGVAGDEHDAGLNLQRGQFALAPDEDGARDWSVQLVVDYGAALLPHWWERCRLSGWQRRDRVAFLCGLK